MICRWHHKTTGPLHNNPTGMEHHGRPESHRIGVGSCSGGDAGVAVVWVASNIFGLE